MRLSKTLVIIMVISALIVAIVLFHGSSSQHSLFMEEASDSSWETIPAKTWELRLFNP